MLLIDYYKTLGLPFDAPAQDIKNAFRQLAKKFHPDVVGTNEFYEERFKDIQDAYKVLSDPSLRKRYNRAYKRFSKNAYSVGNTLVASGTRAGSGQYKWNPTHRSGKSLLSKRQSLFLGLFTILVCVVTAATFYDVRRPLRRLIGHSPKTAPNKQLSAPKTSTQHPRLLATKKLVPVKSNRSETTTSPKQKAVLLAKQDSPEQRFVKMVLPIPNRSALKEKSAPIAVVQERPKMRATNAPAPTPPKPLKLPSISDGPQLLVAPELQQVQHAYAVFQVTRTVHTPGGSDQQQSAYFISGVRPIDVSTQEEQAKFMLGAEVACSKEESKYAKMRSTNNRTISYRIASRKLKTFSTEGAALLSLKQDKGKLTNPSAQLSTQYGYLVFVVKRMIHQPANGTAEPSEIITYTTEVEPYGNLSDQLKAQIIVNGEVRCSAAESRYARTHAEKGATIKYNVISRKLKVFKTEEEAVQSRGTEPQNVALK